MSHLFLEAFLKFLFLFFFYVILVLSNMTCICCIHPVFLFQKGGSDLQCSVLFKQVSFLSLLKPTSLLLFFFFLIKELNEWRTHVKSYLHSTVYYCRFFFYYCRIFTCILQFTTQSSRISTGDKICTWQRYIMMNKLQSDK